MLSLQDFSLVNTKVKKIKEDNDLEKMSDAFYMVAIGSVLDLQDDEIFDSITDNSFLKTRGGMGGHDRGIDAIYIDYDKKTPAVHLFNCKYTEKYKTAKDSNFPSSEIDKIAEYFRALMEQDEDTIECSNTTIKDKTNEIWSVFSEHNPEFHIHLCSNMELPLQSSEKKRFVKALSKYKNINIHEETISTFVTAIKANNRQYANARFRAYGKELFEKSDGDIRALIVSVRADELLRMIVDNEDIRMNVELSDFSFFKTGSILEDIFYDNVRVYKKQRSRINASIVETATSDKRNKFFYYNNGITITCHSFAYSNIAMPVITLEKLQIVNGSQTLHALFEVAKSNYLLLKEIDILCRIYELKNPEYSSKIAEYTNSQNQVTTRDIRSIGSVQIKLESEFLERGYYYERKKNQYEDKPKKDRIDAEKAGQALMAFFNNKPNEAKNKKSIIFSEEYDSIFNDDITSEKVLLAYSMYCEIEERKKVVRKEITQDNSKYETRSYVLHSTYYILYILGQIWNYNNVRGIPSDYISLISYYEKALEIIENCIEKEKNTNPLKYTPADFFKSARAKTYIDGQLNGLYSTLKKQQHTEDKKLCTQ